jgi:threonylcarbamoyladenosine tRNA methylthiotransferase MtaB
LIDDTFIGLMGDEERLMPHLHLSLQAGDDMILKRMRRRHSRGDAISLTECLRARRPDIAFGADLIAGFPTETQEMFERSLSLLDECDIVYAHVFPFSPKRGTPAARMPQLDRGLIKARAGRLRTRGALRLKQHLANEVGNESSLLVEREGFARTPGFAPTRLAKPAEPGTILRARIIGAGDHSLIAEAA